MKTYVIAELGSIAESNLDTMLRQLDAAAAAGCDAVKAQWLSSPLRLVQRRHAEAYAGSYANISYPSAWLGTLRERAHALGMDFGCSCYLREDAWTLEPFVEWLKIASFEAEDRGLFYEIAATGKSVIASVGMRDSLPAHLRARPYIAVGADSVGRTYDSFADWPAGSFAPLHTVSAYPAPMDACNLRVLHAWSSGPFAGFSDHTANVLTGAFAVCAGAQILEFHLRLADSNPANPDYACALDPDQAAEYVRLIRLAESAMGDGIKRLQPCEVDMARFKVGA